MLFRTKKKFVAGIDKIRIDSEEAGRRLLQNYSEKSKNEYSISVETTLTQGYPPDAIIREADAKGVEMRAQQYDL